MSAFASSASFRVGLDLTGGWIVCGSLARRTTAACATPPSSTPSCRRSRASPRLAPRPPPRPHARASSRRGSATRGDARATTAAASTSDADALGIAFPSCAPGEGARGRGLFVTGEDPAVPLVRTPLSVTVCVPEAVGPAASDACVDAVRALYAGWEEALGVAPPESVVEFLTRGEAPKDLRVAVALARATRAVPAWRAYRRETVPAAFDALYLASEDALEALQDETVARMAVGSGANARRPAGASYEASTRRWCECWSPSRTTTTTTRSLWRRTLPGLARVRTRGPCPGRSAAARARSSFPARPGEPLVRAQRGFFRVGGCEGVRAHLGHGAQHELRQEIRARAPETRRRGAHLLRRAHAQRAAHAALRLPRPDQPQRPAADGVPPAGRAHHVGPASSRGRAKG